MSRSPNHEPDKIKNAWQLKVAGHTVNSIAKSLCVPYDTLNDWFYFKTRARLNMLAAKEAGWWKIKNGDAAK